ncbi:hypothetical protein [Geodermatophilus chilensis]|jgi:simple sugar transport system ATP-binding protein|uniref:hypothetical protein n=1 Tax=Geodermatophilus chilensis TaxID=2035835 RepID=UPI000C25F907|nr:hypothetical protein [Geodermatophilus chilensis]
MARDRGVGVVFVTRDPHDAHPLVDRFPLLGRGRGLGDQAKGEVRAGELARPVAGGAEPAELTTDPARPRDEKCRG